VAQTIIDRRPNRILTAAPLLTRSCGPFLRANRPLAHYIALSLDPISGDSQVLPAYSPPELVTLCLPRRRNPESCLRAKSNSHTRNGMLFPTLRPWRYFPLRQTNSDRWPTLRIERTSSKTYTESMMVSLPSLELLIPSRYLFLLPQSR
jgi:hypothetical protein